MVRKQQSADGNKKAIRSASGVCSDRTSIIAASSNVVAKTRLRHCAYALCIMSNHVHYLIEPVQPADLPKIMHFLNWYTAMCFNRMLARTGHFWEKRYYCEGFPLTDKQRALFTLRYIHGNPKAARMRQGFFYEFSNYGTYDRLTDDGLTQWHPAFGGIGQEFRGMC